MFAFALWDHPRGRLMLARDQFGKKPLYIHESREKLLFGSEIKALLAFGDLHPALDRPSIADYLLYRYVPAPHTFFAGIRKLMPGSYALWQHGKLTETSFYTPPYGLSPPIDRPVADPIAAFARELDTAVKIRMVSDVPYGAFLSGGIDSSAIVALMSRQSGKPINTFSVGFREARYSELSYAGMVAREFATRHSELLVSAEDLMQYLPKLIDHGDAPVAEASNIPIYLLSREAAKSVKMVLTGEGSDELLGGYPKHSAERFAGLYQTPRPGLPAPRRRGAAGQSPALPLPAHQDHDLLDRPARSARAAAALAGRALLGRARPASGAWRSPAHPPTGGRSSGARGARACSGCSISIRHPGCPTICWSAAIGSPWPPPSRPGCPSWIPRLAALAARLPDRWRIRGFTQKYILRRVMADILPKEILGRPKVGFRVPVNEWFRGPMRGFVRDHVMGPASLTRELFNGREVEQVLSEHESGRQNHEKLIWTLVNLELFQKRFRLA